MAQQHTVILGNGIAGITTARHLRKADVNARITVVSGESPYFFSRTALMYVYMGHMKWEQLHPYENWFWEKNRIDLVQEWVQRIDFSDKQLMFMDGSTLAYDQLVLATGSKPAFYGWQGQELEGVQGMYSKQDLDNLERMTPAPGQRNHPCKHAVITGGGLIGIELAEMLITRGVSVTMLVREKNFWGNVITAEESRLISNHMKSHGVDLRTGVELREMKGDAQGRVKEVHCTNGDVIACQLVGITTGVRPNIDFLKDSGLEMKRGILVNEFLETSIPYVYAAGDCAELRSTRPGRRVIEPVWYTGRMMGEVLGLTLAGKRNAYLPGPWFNSAKFFDIEYQTYGEVKPVPSADQIHQFWQLKEEEMFITIAYHPDTKQFQGINSYGIRLRHAFFDHALRVGWKVGDVINRIDEANFNPEFYPNWVKNFQADFSAKTGIVMSKKGILHKLMGK